MKAIGTMSMEAETSMHRVRDRTDGRVANITSATGPSTGGTNQQKKIASRNSLEGRLLECDHFEMILH